MKREELVENLEKVNIKLAKIEADEEVFLYATKEKYVAGLGSIEDVSTLKELVEFKSILDKEFKTDVSDTIKGLELTPQELLEVDKGGSKKFMGIKELHWSKDVETKLSELRLDTLCQKLNDAKRKLENHLSDDDKFNMDTKDLDSIILEC